MMKWVVRIPMHQSGRVVGLADVLGLLSGSSDLCWTLLELQAISQRGSGVDAVSLDSRILASSEGLTMSDSELRALASVLEQVIEASLFGCRANSGFQSDREPEVAISALDSTEWRVETNDESVGHAAAAAGLRFELLHPRE